MVMSLDAWRERGASFSWRGQRIFTREEGTGPALLCVHGFPTASYDWASIWPALVGAGFRVLALDLVGFGFSDKPRGFDYSVMAYADLCEAFLAYAGVTRYKLLAHDLGDTVAQELLARQRGGATAARIEAACLLNGGLFPETHRARRSQQILASRIGPLFARAITYRSFASSMRSICARRLTDDELRAMWTLSKDSRPVLHQQIGYMAERRANRARWVGAVVEPGVPVRLVAGTADPVSGAHMIVRYRELVPKPDVVELDGVGHYPQVEAPDRVAPAVLGHLMR
jgi:pimeloyl-ACP methyl ester carboxylesterase